MPNFKTVATIYRPQNFDHSLHTAYAMKEAELRRHQACAAQEDSDITLKTLEIVKLIADTEQEFSVEKTKQLFEPIFFAKSWHNKSLLTLLYEHLADIRQSGIVDPHSLSLSLTSAIVSYQYYNLPYGYDESMLSDNHVSLHMAPIIGRKLEQHFKEPLAQLEILKSQTEISKTIEIKLQKELCALTPLNQCLTFLKTALLDALTSLFNAADHLVKSRKDSTACGVRGLCDKLITSYSHKSIAFDALNASILTEMKEDFAAFKSPLSREAATLLTQLEQVLDAHQENYQIVRTPGFEQQCRDTNATPPASIQGVMSSQSNATTTDSVIKAPLLAKEKGNACTIC